MTEPQTQFRTKTPPKRWKKVRSTREAITASSTQPAKPEPLPHGKPAKIHKPQEPAIVDAEPVMKEEKVQGVRQLKVNKPGMATRSGRFAVTHSPVLGFGLMITVTKKHLVVNLFFGHSLFNWRVW